jgi:membrane protease YdiL (CAAX protease family)
MATNSTAAEADARRRTVRLSAGVIVAFALALLIWAGADVAAFAGELGLGAEISASGWTAAALAAAIYVCYTLWAVPEIRPVVSEVSWFRALAVPMALGSGLIEEMFFRHFLMSWFAAAGLETVLQIIVSAVIFAAVHTIWVVFGRSWRAVLPILLSTFGLGVLMSLVYLASGRIVMPAVVAHMVINLLIEPGLLLSSARHAVRR